MKETVRLYGTDCLFFVVLWEDLEKKKTDIVAESDKDCSLFFL